MMKCGKVERLPIAWRGRILGAPSVDKCEKDCLPGMVVCFEHVDKEALAYGYRHSLQRIESICDILKSQIGAALTAAQHAERVADDLEEEEEEEGDNEIAVAALRAAADALRESAGGAEKIVKHSKAK